jgi:hypothetical protein
MLIVGPSILWHRYEVTNKCVEEVVVGVIDTFQILPQHVSAIHCHHQVVVLPQISVTLNGPKSLYNHNTDMAWVASEVIQSADDGSELLKHGVKFGMYQ